MSSEAVATQLSLAALVIDATTKALIADATISFPDTTQPWRASVTADGYRVFTRIPAGPVRVLVTAPGYQALDITVEIPVSPTLADAVREFWLDPDPVDTNEDRK